MCSVETEKKLVLICLLVIHTCSPISKENRKWSLFIFLFCKFLISHILWTCSDWQNDLLICKLSSKVQNILISINIELEKGSSSWNWVWAVLEKRKIIMIAFIDIHLNCYNIKCYEVMKCLSEKEEKRR